MEFRILGPVEVWDGAQQLDLRGSKPRALLAVLLVHGNQVVSTDHLVDQLWGEAPPPTARNLVQVYVSRLRRALHGGRDRSAAAPVLATRSPGYLLRVEPGELDLHRFEGLTTQARRAAADGDLEGAAERWRAALALWRGPPLAGAASEVLRRTVVPRLEEARLVALEERLEVDLGLGRHAQLVGELEALVAACPERERLRRQLMLALYRSGRQAEALAVYRSARLALVEELGLEPGPALQQLERAILTNDPALAPPAPAMAARPVASAAATGWRAASPVPCQLPPDVGDFTGRDEPLARLRDLLGREPSSTAISVVVCVISGTAGVGKTALAIHAAHQLAERFPDGQLYVNLHGATSGLRPLHPLGVLGRFLRALGVEGSAIPAEVDEAAARFRSQVASRRLLVVLDNARNAAQVHPLKPASPGCGVLVTSRRVLAALDAAHHLHLDVFCPQEAIELLGRLTGQQRIAAEPEATAQLAHWCGGLPLALRIAGARLATQPGWPVSALAERLADQQRRLDELELAEVGMRASFQVSYQELGASADPLDRTAARAFGLLGVVDGPDVSLPVAARLLDQPQQVAERVLERLADAHLLETPTPGRFRLHDLLRLYARELARELHPEPERAAALQRAFGLYVATAWHTLSLLRPGDHRLDRADDRWSKGGLEFADDKAALGWLEAERPNLLAAVQQAAATPGVPAAMAIQLAQALYGFFLVRSYWQDCVQVNQVALGAARQLRDRAAQAQAHNDLGVVCWRQGRYAEALVYQQESLAIRRELGDRYGQAGSLTNLGVVYEWQGHYDEALTCQEESLAIFRELGDRYGQAASLTNLGVVQQRQGRHDEALACHQGSLSLARELSDRHGQAASLNDLGIIHELQGQYDQALACQEESLAIFRELGDRWGQAASLNGLGIVHHRQGRHDRALACQQESLTTRRELGDPHGQAETLRELGVTLRALGRPEEARAHWRQSLAIFERLQSAEADQVRALLAEQPTPSGG
jgi:DNA-binding SARP family transcriptional activator/tetratricopeptide (TPR) repeat protein